MFTGNLNMGDPTLRTIKMLFAQSGNQCAHPGCQQPISKDGTVLGVICHIKARSTGGPRFDASQSEARRHALENLILLCGTCHKRVDDNPDRYTVQDLIEMKRLHEQYVAHPKQSDIDNTAKGLLAGITSIKAKGNSGNIIVGSPGAVVADVVNFKSKTTKQKVPPPPGTIGDDLRAAQYVEHLIHRYNEFASKEPSRKAKFSFGALSANVRSKFGSKWQYLPMVNFHEVCLYLQGRIDKTRLARLNRSRGHPAYSSFKEFTEKHR